MRVRDVIVILKDFACYAVAIWGIVHEVRDPKGPEPLLLGLFALMLALPAGPGALSLLGFGSQQPPESTPDSSPNGTRPVDLRHRGRDGGGGTTGQRSRSRR